VSSAEIATSVRESVRQELESTRSAFHALLNSVPDEDWMRKSYHPNPLFASMSIGQAMLHVTWYPKYIPRFVEAARAGKGFGNLPKFIFALATIIIPRVVSFKETREGVRQKYDQSHAIAISVLDTIREDEWDKGAKFHNEYRTILRVFKYHVEHFQEHAAEIQEALRRR
jgi:hypothetical protein